MIRKGALLLVVILMSATLVASPAFAAKKKGKSKKDFDPWKGRTAIGLRVGGGFGGGGSAFMGQLSVTYWFVQYVSVTAASGYGFYTANYIDYQNEEQTTNVNYIPSELLLTLYPAPRASISPYLGPGIGMDYIWFTLKDFTAKDEDESRSATIYSAIARAGIMSRLASNVSLMFGARYTHPLNQEDDFEDQGGYLGFEGGLLVSF